MDLVVFAPTELTAVLGALRAVVQADGAAAHEERALVEGVARLHGRVLSFDDVAPVAAADVARIVTDPHRRKRCVQLAIVASIAAGPPSLAREDAVRDLATHLEHDEAGLRVLHDMTHGHALFARFDLVRRLRKFIVGHDKTPDLGEVARLAGFREDAALAAKYRALETFPAGSLGHALFVHYQEHGFAMPGEKHGVTEGFVFHDVGHVLSGYGVDPAGEIQQAAFQAGFVRTDGFLFFLFGIMQFHLGLRVTPIAEAEHGFFDVARVMTAAARGAACKVDLSEPTFDFWAYAHLPLAEVRAQFGVPPLIAR